MNGLLLVLVRIGLVWPAANFLMLCRIDCKSVFKVLSLSTEMQFSTDLALMNTKPQRIDDPTQIITEVYLDVQTALRGNFFWIFIFGNFIKETKFSVPTRKLKGL